MLKSPLLRLIPLVVLSGLIYFLWQVAGDRVEQYFHPELAPQAIRVGTPAKDFQVDATQLLAKQKFQLSSLKGTPVLLHFWATWCGPCLGELPELIKQAEALRKLGYSVVTVAEDSDWRAVDRFFFQFPQLKAMQSLMVIVLDPKSEIANLYGSQQFPETFLINQDFVVDNKFVGAQNWSHPAMQSYLDRLRK